MLTRPNKLRNLHKPDDIEKKEEDHSTVGDKSTTEVNYDIESSRTIEGTLDLHPAEVSVDTIHFKVNSFFFIENNSVVNMTVTKDANVTLQSKNVVPTTPACTWWNRPEEDLSSGKSESTHPSRTVVKSIEVFYGVESVVRGNADSLLN